MTNNFDSIYSTIREMVLANRYSNAISHMRTFHSVVKAPWQILSHIDKVDESYRFLKQYALNGVSDPQRAGLLSSIKSDILRIADDIVRFSQIADSPKLYYSVIRYEELQPKITIAQLLTNYSQQHNAIEHAQLVNKSILADGSRVEDAMKNQEALARRIFNLLWVRYPLSIDDGDAVVATISDESLPSHFKELLISGINLGGLEFFDPERLVILSKIYLHQNDRLQIIAICSLLLNLWQHKDINLPKKVKDILAMVFDSPEWSDDLRMVFMELVRTFDTERIASKLTNEILPEMMKIRSEILSKIDESESIDADSDFNEFNPEWEDLIENSSITEKLQQLSELQEDGGDVMMTAFSNLKSFPFFNEVANWFLPFYVANSDIKSVVDDAGIEIAEIIESSEMMCEGDKYSLLLSMQSVPAQNRRAILEQFKMQNINVAEIKCAELNQKDTQRKNIANKFIQGIYRFFKLYRRKSEFNSPFNQSINLSEVDVLAPFFLNDKEILTAVAEFFYKNGYYKEALSYYDFLINNGVDSAIIYQKAGYASQKQGDFQKALGLYTKAEFTHPDSEWTMQRIAFCYKSTNQYDKALKYYKRLEQLRPSDTSIALNIAYCLLAENNYNEAIKYYFKVEYLSPDSTAYIRPMAWCQFILKNFTKSEEYYIKIINSLHPTDNDYMNMGHLQMAMKNFQEASNYYRLSNELSRVSSNDFMKRLQSERKYLEITDVDSDLIDIVFDSVTE